jgi:hypothetical protein
VISTGRTIVVVALLVAAPRGAGAEQARDVVNARGHFDRAVALFRDADYEAALADFDRAYELAPHWGLLYNIGLARAALRDYPGAVEALERHLEDGGAQVPAARREQVEAELRRLRALVGRVAVSVTGPAAATVLVDDAEVGATPLAAPVAVAAGRHMVEVRARGFLPWRRQVVVAGGVTEELRVALEPVPERSGAILVEANVPDATVAVDGEPAGTTPLERPVVAEPGRRVVEVSRRGYETVGRVVEVREGEVSVLDVALGHAADLTPADAGRLAVEVGEEDAEVLVDGAPLPDGLVPRGRHVVEVRRAGFEPFWQEVDVAAGGATRVVAELQPTAAYLDRYRGRARTWRLAAWLTTAFGAAVLAADLALYLWNRGRHVEWATDAAFLVRDAVATPPTLTEGESRQRFAAAEALGEELEQWSIALAVAAGVGAAAVAVGVALFAAGPSPRRYDRFTVAVAPGGLVVAYSGRLP